MRLVSGVFRWRYRTSFAKLLATLMLAACFTVIMRISVLNSASSLERFEIIAGTTRRPLRGTERPRNSIPVERTLQSINDGDDLYEGTQSINSHPFHFIRNPRELCRTSKDLTLFVYVHSDPSHFTNRLAIRRTWGNISQYSRDVRVAFVLGLPKEGDVSTEQGIATESARHRDIIQEDFVDSYRNLTYKAIGALKWVTGYCGHAQYILKVDDDVVVNMFDLLRILRPLDLAGQNEPGTLMCRSWSSMTVSRTGKWAVTKEEFQDYMFPTYCSGLAYIMTADIARALYMTSYNVPFFWVDDVYITGLLTSKLSIKLTDISLYFHIHSYKLDVNHYQLGSGEEKFIFGHIYIGFLERLWADIMDKESKRGTIDRARGRTIKPYHSATHRPTPHTPANRTLSYR